MTTRTNVPTDNEAEDAVIASVLVEPECIHEVATMLRAADFHQESNRAAWECALALYEQGADVNQPAIAKALASRGDLERCGGQTWMADLKRNLAVSGKVQWYAVEVRKAATKRQLLSAASQIAQMAMGDADAAAMLAGADEVLAKVRQRGDVSRSRSAAEVGENVLAGLVSFMDNPQGTMGLSLGLSRQLDLTLGGLVGGRVVTVGAATSVGKSLTLQNIALNVLREGVPIVVVTTEMSPEEWHQRLVYIAANVDPMEIKKRGHSLSGERDRIERAATEAIGWPIHWISGHTPTGVIASEVRRARALLGVQGVFVDYLLHCIVREKGRREDEAVREAMSTLKEMARGNDVWVVNANQVNRDGTKEAGWLRMSMLFGGSACEQDSDAVLLFTPVAQDEAHPIGWRPLSDVEARRQTGGLRYVMCDAAKVRHGQTDQMPMVIDWAVGGGRIRRVA